MKKEKTKEVQYQGLLSKKAIKGVSELGLMMNEVWDVDPKRLTFVLSRYKFVSKMLEGYNRVLEVGCGDGWPARIVQQSVKSLTISDFDSLFIENAKSRYDEDWHLDYIVNDMVINHTEDQYDAIYSIDVLEHIKPENENSFLKNICKSLKSDGTFIVGIPSLESQEYASPQSKEGHVNCKTGKEFKKTMEKYFKNVFLFSMNDEVVHTGFNKMANYLFCICCGKK